MTSLIRLLSVAVTLCVFSEASAQAIDLSGVRLEIRAIDDSSSYLLYRYALVNPPSSSGGVTAVAMDVSATSGTPGVLAVRGAFTDWTEGYPGTEPHAPVGPTVPDGWRGDLSVKARVSWWVPVTTTSSDSVSPGQTLTGIELRSPFFPGFAEVWFDPTVEACCTVPTDSTEELMLDFPEGHAVSGWAVGPRHRRDELSLTLLTRQLELSCHVHGWIEDRNLCVLLGEDLSRATTAKGDSGAVARQLESFLALLESTSEGLSTSARLLLLVNAAELERQALQNWRPQLPWGAS